MNGSARPPLTLLSLNVNGLRDLRKRKTLFSMLRGGHWDVVALQETHHVSASEGEDWAAFGAGSLLAWPGTTFWCHGTSASRGVALLFRDASPATGVSVRFQDPNGRVLAVDFTLGETAFTVVSVYAPVEQANRVAFFTDCLAPVLPEDRQLLVGGDFNCVSDPLWDQQGHAGAAPRTVGYPGGLVEVEAAHDLIDVWREKHPGQHGFTHIAANGHGQSAARLDRWLVSAALVDCCSREGFAHGLPGDHTGVCVSVAPPASVCRGPGPWSFPLPLLHDAKFCSELREGLQAFVLERPIGQACTHAQRWQALKAFIRDFSQQYAFVAGARRRAQVRLLEGIVNRARATASVGGSDPANFAAYQDAHTALQQHHQRQAQLAALRAGVAWQRYGEQSTFYFYHLANRRARASLMSQLRPPQSDEPIVLSSLEAVHEAGQHFVHAFSSDSPTGLFAPGATDPQAQQVLLSSVQRRLSDDAQQVCEGPEGQALQLGELEEALASMAHGKRPGSDGLPYEFYLSFWDILGELLLAVFHEAFCSEEDLPLLPESMRLGLIVLLYKDTGPRDQIGNYRPITLLNADYKLIAKALATRFGRHLPSVIDPTQTAFVPGRWIADNVMCHLEEIDFLQATHEPGCIVILDFAKAYDRLDRPWVESCMQALGFGPQAVRCTRLMQTGTSSSVLFNGWRSPVFPVRSGLPQGSPLSPVLYVIAAQPLSSLLTQQARSGLFACIRLPDGAMAPPCHQHADDTTLHVRSRLDAQVVLDGPLSTFCAASNSAVNRAKSQGLLFGAEAAFEGVDPVLGVHFSSNGGQAKHLGVYVGHDASACSHRMFLRIISGLRMRVGHWSAQRLSFLGRVHVAKQVLGASLWYHATFMRPSVQQMASITSIIMGFVVGGSQAARRSAAMHPNRLLSALDWSEGGVRLLDVDAMITALQSKLIARLLEPEVLPWKAFFLQWVHRSQQCLELFPHLAQRPMDRLGYGLRLLFTAFPLASGNGIPGRQLGYMLAFQSLKPHRAAPVASLSAAAAAREPLFFNLDVLSPDGCALAGGAAHALAAAGIRSVGDALAVDSASIAAGLRPALQVARQSIPHQWVQACTGDTAPRPGLAPGWYTHAAHSSIAFHVSCGEDQVVVVEAHQVHMSGQLGRVLDHVPAVQMCHLLPATVVLWDPSRAYCHSAEQSPQAQFVVACAGLALDPSGFALGGRVLPDYVVREGCYRVVKLKLMAEDASYIPNQPARPRIWEDNWGSAGVPLRGLRACEARWRSVTGRNAARTRTAADPALPAPSQ